MSGLVSRREPRPLGTNAPSAMFLGRADEVIEWPASTCCRLGRNSFA